MNASFPPHSDLPGQESADELLSAAEHYARRFLRQLPDMPTSRPVPLLDPPVLPETGLGGLNTLQAFDERFRAALVGSAGPRYWGFVTGGSTPASVAGDWLASVFDQNPQNPSGEGDISAIIEQQTLVLYRQLLGLPETFLGGFVTGATQSNFTGLAVARQWAGARLGCDVAREGVPAGIRVLAATPHSSAVKSLAMLGMGSQNLTLVKTLPGREAMDLSHLEALLREQPAQPVILISSGGTVNTVDFDDLAALARLRRRFNFWWHIDAAFGGFAALSDTYRHLLTGWEQADSITIDNHKWLNVPYDSGVWLIRHEHASLQVQTFQNTNAPYLGDPLANFNYLNFGPENSRRLRALPVWFTLMAYGRAGYRALIDHSIALAGAFGERIQRSDFLQLEAPVRLNVVCFSLKHHRHDADRVRAFLQALAVEGEVFMSPTSYNGAACIRAAFVNWRTTENDLSLAFQALDRAHQKLYSGAE